ncbi:DUF4138 domain-containing protein [Flagellimonas meridianipacifica]|uniref:Uncharacterized protein DUF4138 n=1 Tax=Flagellimonas meridianipacifica TaxID=1080225 RepID=A0A2T0MF96_9FLAO|nr:DUF4138 domain-containing protein [Allomuricauda pacifica]PRX56257.1 uncharacterized protein DUF4138 [Allomuricauda pacifica]
MKKLYIHTILFFGAVFFAYGQVDTIQVARDYKTMLVFPSPYDFAVNGKELNFLESFPQGSNSPTAQNMVLLIYNDVAPDKMDYTNYTVYTKDGLAYDFILQLVDIPEKMRWAITIPMADNKNQMVRSAMVKQFQNNGLNDPMRALESMEAPRHNFSAGSEGGLRNEGEKKDAEVSQPITLELYKKDKKEYIRRRCFYNQFNKPKVARLFDRSGRVFLWLDGVYYDNNEIYLQFRIENKESIDYDLNFLKFSIATNYRNSSSNQKLDHRPLFEYKVPKRIKGNSANHFIVVFEKFTLDRKKVLVVDMDEDKGNRNLSLPIDHYLINKPLSF